ncbi:MAG: hypothetical protein A6F70_10565 [Cycloclasticus sp. symbiont of Bathymodiolus heckerae]|nr:MAG: hypothetical protein A6F70_10565 [Cycloclasticus sp. symbiont of Bathymodiolus heckerae]
MGRDEVTRTNRGAEGISGRVKFLPLAWAGMPKTSFRKNSDSPRASRIDESQINLGSGKRQVVTGGVLDHSYQITVPELFLAKDKRFQGVA